MVNGALCVQVYVGGYTLNHNFIIAYNATTGGSKKVITFTKQGPSFTKTLNNLDSIESGLYALGLGFFVKVNPDLPGDNEQAFLWQAALPLVGTCHAESMNFDDIVGLSYLRFLINNCLLFNYVSNGCVSY